MTQHTNSNLRSGFVTLAACALAISTATLPLPAGDPVGPDPKAAAVADQVLAAGGGEAALAETKYMRFTFAVEKDGAVRLSRTHYWDRRKSLHRLEMKDKNGANVVCLTHLPSREGVCTVGDRVLMDADAKPWVDRACGAWVEDLFWLLMPYKMKDPGVLLNHDGEVKEGAAIYDKILFRLEGAGSSPEDRGWVYVDRKTHRIDRWAYALQEENPQPGAKEPVVWGWKGWSRFGKLTLSTERISVDGKAKVVFRDVAVFEDLPQEVFGKTSKVELGPPKP